MSHKYPSSHVFYRKLTRNYPRIVRGDGCYLYDDQGRNTLLSLSASSREQAVRLTVAQLAAAR